MILKAVQFILQEIFTPIIIGYRSEKTKKFPATKRYKTSIEMKSDRGKLFLGGPSIRRLEDIPVC